MRFIQKHQTDWKALTLITFAIIFFHWRGLQPGYAFLPIDNVNNNLPWREGPFVLGDLQNPLIGDPIFQFYPFLVSSLETLRLGQWPIWNSNIVLGHPTFADPLFQTFYPVFLLLGLVFEPARALTLGFGLHALIAGWFTYGWLRVLGRSPAAATLGALTYALGGYSVTWFETTFWISTLAWLPAVLFFYEWGLTRQNFSAIGLAALALGFATLAGQFSFVLLFCAFFVTYALSRGFELQSLRQARWRWVLVGSGITLSMGLLLGAVQVLPFAEFLAISHRIEISNIAFVPLSQAITLFIPNFYGNPSTTRAYWGWGNFSEGVMYFGVIAWLILFIGALGVRRWHFRVCLGLSLLFLYFAYAGPGSTALVALPLLNNISPHRAIFILPLIGAYLLASVLDEETLPQPSIIFGTLTLLALIIVALFVNQANLQTHLAAIQLPLIFAAVWFLAGGVLFCLRQVQPLQRQRLNWAIVGFVFLDLYTFGAHFNPALPVAQLPGITPSLEYLQQTQTGHRVATRQTMGEVIFGPNFLLTYGLPDVQGYSSVLPGALMQLVRAGDPASGGYNGNAIWFGEPSQRLLDLLQVKQVVSTVAWAPPDIRTESNATGCQAKTPELTSSTPITGQLTVRDIAINRLDLTFRLDPQISKPTSLTIRMWQGLERQRLMLESQLEFVPAQDFQTATFYFAPEPNSPGQSYFWELSTLALETGLYGCAINQGLPEATVLGTDWSETHQDKLIITERLAPLPRAFVVYRTEFTNGVSATIDRLLSKDFDLRNAAVVNSPLTLSPAGEALATPADIITYDSTHIVIEVSTPRAGLLVLGDYNYPGWEAWVNGQKTGVVPANLLWRGVAVPAGQNQVEFRFEPTSLVWGASLSGVALVTIIGILITPFLFRRVPKSPFQAK